VLANKGAIPPSQTALSPTNARNRQLLITGAQQVLAKIGPSASIEQISEMVDFSPTTIYKYFENKDELFISALGELWHNWVSWSFAQTRTSDDLEVVIDTARSIFRVKLTHPHFALVLHNTLKVMPDFFIKSDEGTAKRIFGELASVGKVAGEDFDQRYELWASMYSGLMVAVLVSEVFSPAEADIALEIGLSVWGISKAKAKKIVSRPLEFAPVQQL